MIISKWLTPLKVWALRHRSAKFYAQPVGVISIILMGFIPVILSIIYANLGLHWCKKIESEMSRLETKTIDLIQAMKMRERFIKEFGMSDMNYLQTYVEPLELLSSDQEILTRMNIHPNYTTYEPIRKRLEFLQNGGNTIQFVTEKSRSSPFYIENEWTLSHPVEVDSQDLKQLLVLLEGIRIDEMLPHPLRPQIFVRRFDLKVKNQGLGHRVFSLDLALLQRGCHECK